MTEYHNALSETGKPREEEDRKRNMMLLKPSIIALDVPYRNIIGRLVCNASGSARFEPLRGHRLTRPRSFMVSLSHFRQTQELCTKFSQHLVLSHVFEFIILYRPITGLYLLLS